MRRRIELLKNTLNNKEEFDKWFLLEKIKMEAYVENKDKSLSFKRAKILEKTLSEMEISLEDNSRLVGTLDDVFVPSYNLFKNELEDFDGYCGYEDLYAEVKGVYAHDEIEKVKRFWMNEDYQKDLSALFNKAEKEAMDDGVYFVEPVTGHAIYDAPTVLAKGYNGLIQLIEDKLKMEDKLKKEDKEEKAEFLEATKIALESGIKFSQRYSDLILQMIPVESDLDKKAELESLYKALQNVPANPASNFYEAVLSFWITYLIMHIEQTPNPYAFSLGRVDQFLYPYYAIDKEIGIITQEDAIELIQELWLKTNVGNKVWAVSQNVVVGGRNKEGNDATNDLTYLIIDATHELGVPLPTLSIKLHSDSPERLYKKAIEVIAKGKGNPTIINDDIVIKSKMDTGVSYEDAIDSVIAGCQELVVQGAENARTTACWFSLPKCLEILLNNGESVLKGKRLGKDYGDLDQFTSFEEFEKIYWEQVECFIEEAISASNRCDKALAGNVPVPFISSIMKDCIENGSDFRKNGARYNFSGFLCHGVANVADSFAVIDQLIFKQKKITFAQLREALKSNWEGHEHLRKLATNVDKYGNDNDYVDSFATTIADRVSKTIAEHNNAYGGVYRAGFSTPSTHVLYGRKCAATPDGRHDRDNFAYGLGPMQGVSSKGPTAIINSVTKFEHYKAHHGLSIGFSFSKDAVAGISGLDRLETLLRVYLKKGGRYAQFNVQDAETLRKAQLEPEKYKDLIVRVHGMSAYFINLDPLIQEDIIGRLGCGI